MLVSDRGINPLSWSNQSLEVALFRLGRLRLWVSAATATEQVGSAGVRLTPFPPRSAADWQTQLAGRIGLLVLLLAAAVRLWRCGFVRIGGGLWAGLRGLAADFADFVGTSLRPAVSGRVAGAGLVPASRTATVGEVERGNVGSAGAHTLHLHASGGTVECAGAWVDGVVCDRVCCVDLGGAAGR